MIGALRQNLDSTNPNQRTYTAIVPQDYLDSLRSSNLTKLQLDHIEKNISNQLSELQQHQINYLNSHSTDSISNFFQSDSSNSNFPIASTANNKQQYTSLGGNLVSFPNLESSSLNRFEKKVDRSNNNSSDLDSLGERTSNDIVSDESTNIEIIERPMTSLTSRKNVSFNKDIDVRIFPKNSKNSKIIESYLLPMSQPSSKPPQQQERHQQIHQQVQSEPLSAIDDNLSNAPNNNSYTINSKTSYGKTKTKKIIFLLSLIQGEF